MDSKDPRLKRRLIGAWSVAIAALRLDRAADPRRRRGRWGMSPLLAAVVIAMTAERKSLRQAEALTSHLSPAVRRRLGIPRRVPDTTMRDVLVASDPEDLRAIVHRQAKRAWRNKALRPEAFPFGVVSMDGRSTTTSRIDGNHYAQTQHDEQGRPLCGLVRTVTSCLISSSSRACLDACPIPAETNEKGVFPAAFSKLVEIYGEEVFQVVITDGGPASKENGRLVEEAHRAYIFRIKEDQPTLLAEARRVLERRGAALADATTQDRVGKTTVIRRAWTTKEMAGFHGWKHLRTALRVESEKRDEHGTVVSVEQRYYVSSLRLARLSGAQWLKVVRMHWRVENNNHWVFDEIFEEDDRPWIVDPRGMLVVMMLRRLAYNVLALFRSVTQRSETKRQRPWRDLMYDLHAALLSATEEQLAGLRRRKLAAACI